MEYAQWGQLVYDKIHRWMELAVRMLPNLVAAIIILLLFIFLARLFKKLVYKIVFRLSDTPALSGLLSSIGYLAMFFIGLSIALDVLQLDKTVSSLLAGAGIIGLALGFAFQDLTANFISGIYITFRKPFDVGHQVETNGFTGTVENIELRSTTLRTIDGLHVIIPNKDIFQKPIINHSLTPGRRLTLSFTVPLNHAQTAAVQDLVLQSLQGLPEIAPGRPCQVLFSAIEGANVRITLNCWVNNDDVRNYDLTMDAIITRVMAVLRAQKMV
ncbi:mechanosensitive ion channel family protein [Chitinophaga japonensis]|uniref:Small-conductance mechanosensitive channel n=1 Tax=Chitinophaga japonensis TaxID=104662 RepID=A0A562T4I9_CHIJA|nr:mechanosensitive ion channel family protein [Chitinophaga japonensis]TWI87976.1 small-conductance mechanosensitive channel [Chitinophaga japonensis]